MTQFRITIASPPHRERLVSEIVCEGFQWAEISQETEELIVQFYSYPQKKAWEFALDEAIEILREAKATLVNGKEKNE